MRISPRRVRKLAIIGIAVPAILSLMQIDTAVWTANLALGCAADFDAESVQISGHTEHLTEFTEQESSTDGSSESAVTTNSPVWGFENSPVAIVTFFDYECPHSRQDWLILETIMRDYPQDVKVTLKLCPNIKSNVSKQAAALAKIAYEQRGIDGFLTMHRRLMDGVRNSTTEKLRRLANAIDSDAQQVYRVMSQPILLDAQLANDVAEAESLWIRGTPYVFLNGVRLRPRTLKNYRRQITRILDGLQPLPPTRPPPTSRWRPHTGQQYFVPIGSPRLGASNAPITVVEFIDFRSQDSIRLHKTMLEDLAARAGNDVAIILKCLPKPGDRIGERAAAAVGYTYRMIGNVSACDLIGRLAQENGIQEISIVRQHLELIGLDMEQCDKVLNDEELLQGLLAPDRASAHYHGVQNAPTVFVNGHVVSPQAGDYSAEIDRIVAEIDKRDGLVP